MIDDSNPTNSGSIMLNPHYNHQPTGVPGTNSNSLGPWALRLCMALQGLDVFGQALHLRQQLLLLGRRLGWGEITMIELCSIYIL